MSSPDDIHGRARDEGLLAGGRPVVVMFSGGRDSTCLLDLAVRIAGREAVSALHVNYRLRAAADGDQRHCAQTCERLGLPLTVHRPPSPQTGNLQAWARDVRYGAAAALARQRGADVAAGHTATDQVETILYRLASSPSRRALRGMSPRDGSLIRPLLRFSRGQIAVYCADRGLRWREDESNSSDAFARNRVRGGLVPALRAIHPGAEENVLALAEILRDEAAVLDGVVDGLLQSERQIPLAELRELPSALRRLVVQRLADDAVDGLVPGAARRAEAVCGLSDEGTAQLDVGQDVVALAEYGTLRFERRPAAHPAPPPAPLTIPGSVAFGGLEIRCELGPPTRAPGVLDRDGLGPELLVRAWRPGDRMSPLGLQGRKSLQDLFTARRVPRRERGRIAVVESGGEIAWVAGVATSERFKVTDATTEAVHLSAAVPEPQGRASAPS